MKKKNWKLFLRLQRGKIRIKNILISFHWSPGLEKYHGATIFHLVAFLDHLKIINIMNTFWLKKKRLGQKTRKFRCFWKRLFFFWLFILIVVILYIIVLTKATALNSGAQFLPFCTFRHTYRLEADGHLLWRHSDTCLDADIWISLRELLHILPEIQFWEDEDTLLFCRDKYLTFLSKISRKTSLKNYITGF